MLLEGFQSIFDHGAAKVGDEEHAHQLNGAHRPCELKEDGSDAKRDDQCVESHPEPMCKGYENPCCPTVRERCAHHQCQAGARRRSAGEQG